VWCILPRWVVVTIRFFVDMDMDTVRSFMPGGCGWLDAVVAYRSGGIMVLLCCGLPQYLYHQASAGVADVTYTPDQDNWIRLVVLCMHFSCSTTVAL
jgi:hypothetical protein